MYSVPLQYVWPDVLCSPPVCCKAENSWGGCAGHVGGTSHHGSNSLIIVSHISLRLHHKVAYFVAVVGWHQTEDLWHGGGRQWWVCKLPTCIVERAKPNPWYLSLSSMIKPSFKDHLYNSSHLYVPIYVVLHCSTELRMCVVKYSNTCFVTDFHKWYILFHLIWMLFFSYSATCGGFLLVLLLLEYMASFWPCRIRTMAIKFMEMIILAQTKKEAVSCSMCQSGNWRVWS